MIPWVYYLYKKWLEQHGQVPSVPTDSPPNGAPSAPSRLYRWTHREYEFRAVLARAIATAKRGAWRTLAKAEFVRQVRALLLASLRIAGLSTHEPEQLGYLNAQMYSSPERNAAGSAIARTAPSRVVRFVRQSRTAVSTRTGCRIFSGSGAKRRTKPGSTTRLPPPNTSGAGNRFIRPTN